MPKIKGKQIVDKTIDASKLSGGILPADILLGSAVTLEGLGTAPNTTLVTKEYVQSVASTNTTTMSYEIDLTGGATNINGEYSLTHGVPTDAKSNVVVYINGVKIDVTDEVFFSSAYNGIRRSKPNDGDLLIFDLVNLDYSIDAIDEIKIIYQKDVVVPSSGDTTDPSTPETTTKSDTITDTDANENTIRAYTCVMDADEIRLTISTNSEITLNGGVADKIYKVVLIQNATGMKSVTFSNLKNTNNVFSLNANAKDILRIIYTEGQYFLESHFTA